MAHFQKQTFSTSSLTTDGTYLYFYISSNKNGKFKIGTGENGTVPGKVYLTKPVLRFEDVTWVFVSGKIYIRTQSMDPGTLGVINPDTLEQEA